MPGTIKEKLDYLAGTKDAIKQAIEAKGVTVAPEDNFRSYATKIGEITGGGGGGGNPFEGLTDYSFMFYYGARNSEKNIKAAIENSKKNKITSVERMFYQDKTGGRIDITGLDTSSVTNFAGFAAYSDTKIEILDVFNTNNATDMSWAFEDAAFGINGNRTEKLVLSDTSKVKKFRNAFRHIGILNELGPIDLTSATDVTDIFEDSSGVFCILFNPEQKSFSANLSITLYRVGVNNDARATRMFNSLPDITKMVDNKYPDQEIYLPLNNKISEEVKSIARNKGWTINN